MANEKFDSILERAIDEATIESLRRREQEIIADLNFILSHYAADENEEDGDDEDYGGDDWYDEESED